MAKYHKIKVICDACCRAPSNPFTGEMFHRGKSACGFIILDVEGQIICEQAKYLGELNVSQAEYEGLIFALDRAVEFCRGEVEVWMDSEVVIKQMNGDYCIRSSTAKQLFDEVKKREQRFIGPVKYFHHNRGSFWARHADKLANEEYSRNQAG